MFAQDGWLWLTSPTMNIDLKSTLATYLWPCGIFARITRRLRAVRLGQDAKNIPEPGCFSPECGICVVLIPCFCCRVGRLQTRVRSLYGISGNVLLDQCYGIFCPCFAMTLLEQEILVREEQRKRLAASHSKQYQHHDPMTYLSPESATTKLSSKQTSSSPETTSAQNLGKHSLDDHKMIAAESVRSPHSLETDSTIPPLAKTTTSNHHVCRDPLADLVIRGASHDLNANKTTPFVNLNHDHNLARDVLASSATGGTVGHGLPAHKPTQVRVTRPTHQLSDDATIVSESKRDTGHVLDEHAKGHTLDKLTEAKRMPGHHAGVAVTGSEVGSSKMEEA